MYRAAFLALVTALLLGMPAAIAADLDGIRGPTPMTADPAASPLPGEASDAGREARSFADQPPVIPHSIVGYRLDAKANDCLSCHGRTQTGRSAAPTISSTHFVDRDGRVSPSLTPARYFCTQCHVSQKAASPPIGNNFEVLATIPFRRHVCLECHLPQIEASPVGATSPGVTSPGATSPGATSPGGNDAPR